MRFGPDYDALVERFSPEPHAPILVAVSGGGDSVALLRLAHDWAQRTEREVIAVTIDHRLREDAAQEPAMENRYSLSIYLEDIYLLDTYKAFLEKNYQMTI